VQGGPRGAGVLFTRNAAFNRLPPLRFPGAARRLARLLLLGSSGWQLDASEPEDRSR